MKRLNDERSGKLTRGVLNNFSSYLLIILVIFLGISLFRNISNVNRVEEKIASKEKEVEKARQEQEELIKKLEYAKSQEYIEKQLREKLGLAREGEIVVIMPPPEVLRKFAPKHEEEVEVLPDPNWKKWMKLFI